jgi:hypothetical protein
MRGATRACVSANRLTAVIAAMVASLGMQAALASTAGAAATHGTATVTIEVNGLPRHARGNVKLTGPAKQSRRLTTTTKLQGVASGTYTVTAQPVVSAGKSYRPTVTLCSASGRCSPPVHGRITVKAHQHVTVRVTYALPKKAGTVSPVSPGTGVHPPAATLVGGNSETGGWSALIDVPAGGPQAQAMGVVSYPIPLAQRPLVVYRNEVQTESPTPPCVGSVTEPIALPGYLCVYRTGNFGSREAQDKNAKFFGFQDLAGNATTNGAEEGGLLGELIVFRTNEFNAEHPITISKEAALFAAGSWAVTAK